ncbi:MAG: SUMF1/EgtB/PvdO family nonheme iron enzyme [Verrucomicrobia bacterium]|nr:SUMF1/EgtB/PvdO family nonheme iron enzyme [Verrucomicrobiota bacterium]
MRGYPWGEDWPPPKGAGNFAGEEAIDENWWYFLPVIEGYNDGYVRTSPMGGFAANRYGLYDMAGIACQWCDDWLDDRHLYRVVRGSSWCDASPDDLRSSKIWINEAPVYRYSHRGFRCLVAQGN